MKLRILHDFQKTDPNVSDWEVKLVYSTFIMIDYRYDSVFIVSMDKKKDLIASIQ